MGELGILKYIIKTTEDVESLEMTAKQLRDLTFESDLDKYIDWDKPKIVDQQEIEKILGCRINISSVSKYVLNVKRRLFLEID